MPTPNELVPVLKRLRLSGLLETLDLRTREAVDGDLTHGEFLLRLFTDEVERRENKQLEMRLRRANFDGVKRLDDFDWSFNPKIPKAKIIDLGTLWRTVEQEAADELDRRELHDPRAVPVGIVLPAEADLAVVERDEPLIGDCHADV